MTDRIELKYPLILVHGIIAHDRTKYFNFWGRVPKTLKEKGIKVFLGNTDSWGSCETNAKILKENIDKILLETGSQKVNIIAHSKGGIDSRFLIWKYNYGGKIASLTTISTPHHGSELANLLFKQDILHKKIVKKALNIFGKLYGDTNPDLFNVNYQLTTDRMKEFNKNIIMDKNVYCQSLYTLMKKSFDDLMFYSSHCYLKKEIGENDGMVCEYSANWGENVKKIEGRISHAEILDYKQKNIFGTDIINIYLNIVKDLAEKGF